MCSVQEDIEDLGESCKSDHSKIFEENRNLSSCKKCGEKSILLLQKKDPFCRKCFFDYSDHKFRSTIGKTKKIKHGQKVLLACSGGRKSTALLHMTKQALESASAKQISFIPGILFIDESALLPSSDNMEQVKEILKRLANYGYPVLYSSLEMLYNLRENCELYRHVQNCDLDQGLPVNIVFRDQLKQCIEPMCLSSKIDFIKHIRHLLMTTVASQTGYDYVFVGDSASSLAIDLLTDISLGRGSQISSDTNFLDSRYKPPICRPIREFLDKELALYNYLHCCSFTVLPDLLTKTDEKSSVQRLAESFISGLQKDFPATVFTIFRTGGKLSKYNSTPGTEICHLCMSELDNINPEPCSALEALKLSHKLSQTPLQNSNLTSDISSGCCANNHIRTKDSDIFKLMCHGCNIPFRNNMVKGSFLPFVASRNYIRTDRHAMKEEIAEFILNEEETT